VPDNWKLSTVRQFYEDPAVWSRSDGWHAVVAANTKRAVAGLTSSAMLQDVVNLGSGGKTFELRGRFHVHVDIVHARLLHVLGVIASAEQLPLADATFDLALCVGGVINHSDAPLVISEAARVLRPGGRLVLEFDSLDGLQHFAEDPQANAAVVDTFFNGRQVRITEYTRSHITELLRRSGFQMDGCHSFHILSALLLRFGCPPAVAARFAILDPVARWIRPIRFRGTNVVLTALRR